jgi:large subunit ribosomal protein L2
MAQVIAKEGDYAQVRMPSGEVRMIHLDCRATIGQVSNIEHSAVVIGSAGKTRHKGRRPWSRGIAKNPVDHPHGGRTNGGRHPVTPWGFPTKGKKTRNSKRTDSFIIKRKRG